MKQLSLGSFGAPTVGAATFGEDLRALANRVPLHVHLGTSSWAFPGWAGLVYDHKATPTLLAQEGLAAYARHPLFRSVGIDRGFYAPLSAEEFARYAAAVPPHFRFLIKAPASITDRALRDRTGTPIGDNSGFLDADAAITAFIEPVREGLGDHAGPLLFQLSPMPNSLHVARIIAELDRFLARLPKGPLYAVEVRDASLATAELCTTLSEHGVRYAVGLHPRMPDAKHQLALAASQPPGPLVVRWNLTRLATAPQRYDEAKRTFAPFDAIQAPDDATVSALAEAIAEHAHAVFLIANNKAEGAAPLTLRRIADAAFGERVPAP